MNYFKHPKASIKSTSLLLIGSLSIPLLTGCEQEFTITAKSSDENTSSIELGNDLTVTAGEAITIIASANNLNSDALTYQWEQTSGDLVSLSADNRSYIAFTSTVNDLLAFDVTATDSQGIEYTDSIFVTVLANDESIQDSVQLSWSAPTENEDGSSLTNLAGYNIYYGHSESAMNTSISISDPLQTLSEIDSLELDYSYFFCVSAYNSQGLESECSDVVEIIL